LPNEANEATDGGVVGAPFLVAMKSWTFLVSCVACASLPVADARVPVPSGALRGGKHVTLSQNKRDIPGWAGPEWGGRTFRDSPAAVNSWTSATPWSEGLPDVLGNMDPVAPQDTVSEGAQYSLSGTEPTEPSTSGSKKVFGNSALATRPDWVPKYGHPPTFPAESDHLDRVLHNPENPLIKLGDRQVVAKPDRLRTGANQLENEWRAEAMNYPLVAPADAGPDGGAWAVAHADAIPEHVARYLTQAADSRERWRDDSAIANNYKYADGNRDGKVSRSEFDTEVIHRQGKTPEEAQALWDSAKGSGAAPTAPLTEQEFAKLSRSGFDVVTAFNRSDVTSVVSVRDMSIDRGYWGRGATCPIGRYATGARLKRQNYSGAAKYDNTGLNAIDLKCDGDVTGAGMTASSHEGPDGQWTAWQNCPSGQVMYGFKIRTMAFASSMDNSGVNDLSFACRPRPVHGDMSAVVNNAISSAAAAAISGSSSPSALGELDFTGGPSAGGWSENQKCLSANSAICGVQVRMVIDQDEEDDIGVTDVRFYCCGDKINCDAICAGSSLRSPTPECRKCRDTMGVNH